MLREHLSGRDDAFAELVCRHADMVYASASRQVRDPHLADDVAQAVFLLLWRKAGALGGGTVLAGWLHRATGYCAANALRLGAIRKRHERKAASMTKRELEPEQSAGLEHSELSATLDRAVARLSPPDRAAVVMRFFEGRSAEEVAAALQVSPDAARKRVDRAVEKLGAILSRLGVTTATPALTTFLASRCIVPLPAHVMTSITQTVAASAGSTAVSCGAAGTIAKGALMAMSIKTKSVAATAILVLLLIGSASVFFADRHKHDPATRVVATTPGNLIRVRARIDGRSRLCIRGNTVQWVHLEYDPPGVHGNVQGPTLVNGMPWIPVWLDVPFGARQCVSEVHYYTAALLPADAVQVSVSAFTGRGKVTVVQQPAAANGFTAIVEFDDSVAAGAADYSADIIFKTAHAPPVRS